MTVSSDGSGDSMLDAAGSETAVSEAGSDFPQEHRTDTVRTASTTAIRILFMEWPSF